MQVVPRNHRYPCILAGRGGERDGGESLGRNAVAFRCFRTPSYLLLTPRKVYFGRIRCCFLESSS